MKKDLNNHDKQIFRDLYESIDGLYAYTFYSRYKMSPSIVFEFIAKYEQEGVLIFDNGKISLTGKGRSIALLNVKKVKKAQGGKFSNIPNEFIDVKLRINSVYLPNTEDL